METSQDLVLCGTPKNVTNRTVTFKNYAGIVEIKDRGSRNKDQIVVGNASGLDRQAPSAPTQACRKGKIKSEAMSIGGYHEIS